MLCMYDENVRYITGTLTPGWNRLKPGLRYAMLCGDGAPILFEQGDLGFQIERHSPWIPKENVRHSFAWIKGAAGPAADPAGEQVHQGGAAGDEGERRRRPEARLRLHRHQHDQHLQGEQHQLGRRHDADDGGARGQERRRAGVLPHRRRDRRRHALGVHEVPAPRHHREPGHRAPDGVSLQHPRHGGRRGRHRVVRPEHLAELAQLLRPHHPARRHRVHGFGRADLERLQVLLLPHLLRRQGADARSRRKPTRPR